MNSDKTVTVEFGVEYQLTTSVIGGNGTISPTSGTYVEGSGVQIRAFPADGYAVKAWSGTNNDSSTSTINTVTMTSDKTVTVEFGVEYQLTTSVAGGNGSLSPPSGPYVEGTVVNLTAIPYRPIPLPGFESDYRAKKWTGTNNDASLSENNTVTMTSDKTVSIEFEQ